VNKEYLKSLFGCSVWDEGQMFEHCNRDNHPSEMGLQVLKWAMCLVAD